MPIEKFDSFKEQQPAMWCYEALKTEKSKSLYLNDSRIAYIKKFPEGRRIAIQNIGDVERYKITRWACTECPQIMLTYMNAGEHFPRISAQYASMDIMVPDFHSGQELVRLLRTFTPRTVAIPYDGKKQYDVREKAERLLNTINYDVTGCSDPQLTLENSPEHILIAKMICS